MRRSPETKIKRLAETLTLMRNKAASFFFLKRENQEAWETLAQGHGVRPATAVSTFRRGSILDFSPFWTPR